MSEGGDVDRDVTVHGPGFAGGPIPAGERVLLQRNVARFTRGRREQRLLEHAAHGVYDLDDGLPWDDGSLPGLGHWWKRPWPRSLVARRAADAATTVIAGNEVIANWASDHCGDVRIVPTCVEPGDYTRRDAWDIDAAAPVIGWIGSPATQGFLLDVMSALDAVHAATSARVEVIGADPAAFERWGFVDVVAWSEDAAHRRLATWDVGIMPLRDGAYERAKCGYKLLQYAAAGVPAVGSPVGVNAALLDAMHGWSPTSLDDWTDALGDALGSASSRRADAARAGFTVAAEYSYDRWYDRWLDASGWSR